MGEPKESTYFQIHVRGHLFREAKKMFTGEKYPKAKNPLRETSPADRYECATFALLLQDWWGEIALNFLEENREVIGHIVEELVVDLIHLAEGHKL
ncbi:MAG: hypothetical protein KC592_20370 [Nitrospira sp.]|nr:hypothetical protein [Nitrospira sp.]